MLQILRHTSSSRPSSSIHHRRQSLRILTRRRQAFFILSHNQSSTSTTAMNYPVVCPSRANGIGSISQMPKTTTTFCSNYFTRPTNCNSTIRFSTNSSSSPSSISEKEIEIKEATVRWLDLTTFPLGSLDVQTWMEIEATIVACSQLQTPASIEDAFSLLDRLSEEVKIRNQSTYDHDLNNKSNINIIAAPPPLSSLPSSMLDTTLLNTLVDAWKRFRTEEPVPSISLHPKDILAKLVTYESRPWPITTTQTSSIVVGVIPNVQTYSMVVQVASHANVVYVADLIWNHLVDRAKKDVMSCHPDTQLLNDVIQAWTSSGRHDSAGRAELILLTAMELKSLVELQDLVLFGLDDLLQVESSAPSIGAATASQPSCQPNTNSFQSILECWAVSGEKSSERIQSAERADALLQRMKQYHQELMQQRGGGNGGSSNLDDCKPNAACYMAVMKAWSTSGHANAPAKCQTLVDEMNAMYEAGDLDMKPSMDTYGHLLTSVVQSKHESRADKVREILQEMHQIDPNAAAKAALASNIYNKGALIEAYARSIVGWAKAGKTEKADRILQQMIQDEQIQPDILMYTVVMQSWQRRANAAPRVQALFDQAWQSYQAGNEEAKPDWRAYSVLISSWVESADVDAPRKAFDTLVKLTEQIEQRQLQLESKSLPPFQKVLVSLCRVDDMDRAEQVLRCMDAVGLAPNISIYDRMLFSWLRIQSLAIENKDAAAVTEAAERAQAIFDELIHKYEEGNQQCKPTKTVYELMMNLWSRVGTDSAFRSVRDLFWDMSNRSKEDNDLKPTKKLYSQFLDALSKTGTEAYEAVETLQKMAETGTVAPWLYSELIATLCKVGEAEHADEVLKQMIDADFVPDIVSTTSVMQAWSKCGHENAAQRIQSLFDLTVQQYQDGHVQAKPDEFTYSVVMNAWRSSTDPYGPSKAQAILDDLIEKHQSGEINFPVSEYHCMPVIDAWCRAGNLEGARSVLRQMKGLGISPNYELLLGSLIRCQASNAAKGDRFAVLEAAQLGNALFDDLTQQFEAGETKVLLTQRMYSALMHLWSQSGHEERSARIIFAFRDMLQRRRNGMERLRPGSLGYLYYIEALAETDEVDEAEIALYRMEKERLNASSRHYSHVLKALSRSGSSDAAERAQVLLDAMMTKYDAGDQLCKPSVSMFTEVVRLWAHSNRRDAPRRAQALFDEILSRSKSDESFKPNVTIYSSLFEVWNKAGDLKKINAVLQQMAGKELMKANIPDYNAVISCCASSDLPSAGDTAQAMYDEAAARYEAGDIGFKPNLTTYSLLIAAWSYNAGRKDALQKAQAVFDLVLSRKQMMELDGELEPTVYTKLIESWCRAGDLEKAEEILRAGEGNVELYAYTVLMDSWLRSGHPNAVERAQSLFDNLLQKYDSGIVHLKPTLSLFGAMVGAWGKSERSDSAARAQTIFSQLIARYKAGDEELKPSIYEYNALLEAWAKGGEVEKAEYIFRQINTSKAPVRSNFDSLSIVLQAWFRSKRPDGPDRGQALLDEVIQKYKHEKSANLSVSVFSQTMMGWIRSGRKESAEKCQAVFNEMLSLHHAGELGEPPTVEVYNMLLTAWAKAGKPENAEALLKVLCGNMSPVSPDVRSYGAVITAWSRSGSPTAGEQAERLLRRMQTTADPRCRPNRIIYSKVIQTWSKSNNPLAFECANALLQEMMEQASRGDTDMSPDFHTYQFYLQALDKSTSPNRKEHLQKALDSMKKLGIQPDESFHGLIKRCGGKQL